VTASLLGFGYHSCESVFKAAIETGKRLMGMGQVKTPQSLQFLPRFNWFFWEIHIPWIVVGLWLIFILLKKLGLTIFVSVLAFMEEPNFLPHSKSASRLLTCSCAQVFHLHLKNSMCRFLFFHLKYCLVNFIASYLYVYISICNTFRII